MEQSTGHVQVKKRGIHIFATDDIYGYLCFLYNVYIFSYNFFCKNKLFKLFMSLECKYNKLEFGIRISYIEVSRQKLHSFMALLSTTRLTAKKSIQEGVLFSRTNRFRMFSWKHWCLSSHSQQKSEQKLP